MASDTLRGSEYPGAGVTVYSELPDGDSVNHSGPLEKGSILTRGQFLGQLLNRLCGNGLHLSQPLRGTACTNSFMSLPPAITTASPLSPSFRGIRSS